MEQGSPVLVSIGLLNGGAAVIYVLWMLMKRYREKDMDSGQRER